MMKEVIALIIRFSGIPWIMREWIGRRKITIIVYHNPSIEAFSCHLSYLSKHYHFITLNDAVDAVLKKETNCLPSKSLVITFDDGHAGNFDLLELFKHYHIHPTIYLNSHIVCTHRHFWPTVVKEPAKSYNNISHHDFLSGLKKDYDFKPDREYTIRQALDDQELSEMAPWVDLQSHGRYHFSLTDCDDDTARAEIEDSRKKIKEIIRQDCIHFCYPFGYYSDRDVKLVKESGYQSARTTDPGFIDVNTDPFRLKAIAMIPDHASKNMLCAQISGLPGYVDYWLTRRFAKYKRLPENHL